MIIFIELLLILTVGIIVGYPLFVKKQETAAKSFDSNVNGLPHLLVQKEVAYATLKDLNFDFKTGKLSEEDYEELKTRYEKEALIILEKIDKISKKKLSPTPKNKKKTSK